MALNININNKDKEIKVMSLKWDDSKGEYITFGDGHMMTIEEEVQQIFESVWDNTMDSIWFSLNSCIMDVYNMMKGNVLYTVDMYYRAGRYTSSMDMVLVANSVVDFIWNYFLMEENYSEEEDNSNKIVY